MKLTGQLNYQRNTGYIWKEKLRGKWDCKMKLCIFPYLKYIFGGKVFYTKHILIYILTYCFFSSSYSLPNSLYTEWKRSVYQLYIIWSFEVSKTFCTVTILILFQNKISHLCKLQYWFIWLQWNVTSNNDTESSVDDLISAPDQEYFHLPCSLADKWKKGSEIATIFSKLLKL